MAQQENNHHHFIEYDMTADYVVSQQFNSSDNLKSAATHQPTFIYQQDHVHLEYSSSSTTTNTSINSNLLPQSPPDHFQQCDDNKSNTDSTSCCTSPSSILYSAAVLSTTMHQHFPSPPSPSPYQYASETIMMSATAPPLSMTTRDHHQQQSTETTTAFYADFLQSYSVATKETTFDQNNFIMNHTNNKRKRFELENTTTSFLEQDPSLLLMNTTTTSDELAIIDKNDDLVLSKDCTTKNDAGGESTGKLINSELRRQIHIQSEQKRRAQIKDGFEDLRNELPSCLNKKMSKVALLHRTVQHIQHLKNTQMTILAELERLAGENEQLRKFQDNVVQKQQSLEKIYSSLSS